MDDYTVIVSGVERMLAPFGDRIEIVELVSLLPVESPVDVLLYDTYSQERATGPLEQVIGETDAKVVLCTWHLEEEVVSEALAKGAHGCLSKALPADELVRAIEEVHSGSVVVSKDPGRTRRSPRRHGRARSTDSAPGSPRCWPSSPKGSATRRSPTART